MSDPQGDTGDDRQNKGSQQAVAHHDGSSIGEEITDAVRYGDAGGVRAEIVIVDQARGQIPAHSGILEIADQFALFGIHADDGVATTLESVSKIAQVEELSIAIGTVIGREFLVIDPKGIAHPMEKTGDGVGADDDTEIAQRHGNLLRSATGPLQPGDGIAGGVIFEQKLDQRDDVGVFFRPACARRRSGGCVPRSHFDRAVAGARGQRCGDPGREMQPRCCRRRAPV